MKKGEHLLSDFEGQTQVCSRVFSARVEPQTHTWCDRPVLSATDHTVASAQFRDVCAGQLCVMWGKIWERPGVVVHSLNPSVWEAEAVAEFKVRMVYIGSSTTSIAM